jgi:uncharacterized protein (DUF2252 family)
VAIRKPGIVDRIREFNAGRDPERLALKYRAMRASPYAFLRGTCHLFYGALAHVSLPEDGPLVWACGDLHLENFGSYKGDNRLVYFDLNDFDEAALAPCTWDLARLLTSVLVAARTLGVDEPGALRLCREFVDAYAAALLTGKARWVERETAQGMVRDLLDSTRNRNRAQFLDRRTERAGGHRRIRIDGKKALAVDAAQRKSIETFLRGFALTQQKPGFFRLLDVARRIAGTGSLGVERFVILIEGKGSPDANYLLDLKQALPSTLVQHLEVAQPHWGNEAERVVRLQERVQAISPAFLHSVVIGGLAYILKGLQPTEDRVALDQWQGHFNRLLGLMTTLGEIVAWSELRSAGREGSASADELIEFGGRKKWRTGMVAVARACQKQVDRDWREFCAAFDDGEFPIA